MVKSMWEIMTRGHTHGNQEMGITAGNNKEVEVTYWMCRLERGRNLRTTLRFLALLLLRPLSVGIFNGCSCVSSLCKPLDRKAWFMPILTSQ